MKSPDDFHRQQTSSHVPSNRRGLFLDACTARTPRHIPSNGRYRRAITMDLHDVSGYLIESRETR